MTSRLPFEPASGCHYGRSFFDRRVVACWLFTLLLLLQPCMTLAQEALLLEPPDITTASLSACVLDADTRLAVPDVAVVVSAPILPAGQSGKTDEFGCVSFAGLPPGRYKIVAGGLGSGFLRGQEEAEASSERNVEQITISLTRAASLVGVVEDQDGNPIAAARVSATVEGFFGGRPSLIDFRGRRTDQAGRFEVGDLLPGIAFVLLAEPPTIRLEEVDYASAAQSARDGTMAVSPALAPVYHPNAPNRSSALAITPQPGEQPPIAPLVMERRDGFCIVGYTEAADLPQDTRLSVILQTPQPLGQSVYAGGQTSPGKGFQACGLTAGTYKLLVRSQGTTEARFATREVVISDRHEVLGGMVLAAGRHVNGEVLCGDAPCEPAQLATTAVRFSPAERIAMGDSGVQKPNAEGRFSSPKLFDDRYLIDVHGLPATACVEAIRSGGRDVTRTGWNPGEGNLTVQLRMECGQIRGRVEGRNVERFPHLTVVVTPEAYPDTKDGEVQAVAADEDGYYSVAGLPTGRYKVCLETRLPPTYALSFAAIDACRAKANDVSVGARATELLNLRAD
jgi:hypothetical protein